ncbi:MAG TPA: RNA polymerase factor sigma-54, partial [Casimicrobiaceae bacterium]|nr:RNA polymerase factor sigma-54 [Casimicrobiaceae bacterium]
MKPTLQLKLSQHLTLTPQLQQSIRLLQLSTLELNAEVERLLQENPLLEKAEDDEHVAPPPEFAQSAATSATVDEPLERADGTLQSDFDSMTSAAGDGDWGSSTGGTDDDDENFSPQQVATSSLRDHLNSQLAELNLPLRDRQIVSALIDALNDDGYLTTSLEELLEFFPEELGIDADELQIALRHLQNFEPAGVGARDASECLALQLKVM